MTALPFLEYASLDTTPGDKDPFHAVLADRTPLRADSPLHAWVSRIDALPRS